MVSLFQLSETRIAGKGVAAVPPERPYRLTVTVLSATTETSAAYHQRRRLLRLEGGLLARSASSSSLRISCSADEERYSLRPERDSESLKVMGTIASSNLFSPSEPKIPSSEYPRSNGEERQGQRDCDRHPRKMRLVPCPGFSYAPRRAGSMDREHLVGRAGAIAPCGKSDLHRDEGPAHGYRPAVRVGLVARRRGDQERVRAVHLEGARG